MSVKNNIDGNFLYYFDQGKVIDAYRTFGSHLVKDNNGKNVACEFCVYAPNASGVVVKGEWNNYEETDIMTQIDPCGIWYIKLEGDYEWKQYKYVIYTKDGRKLYKADPYAYYSGYRPSQDSRVYDIEGYHWNDDVWMFTHPKTYDKPVLIYELHLGSWRRPDSDNPNSYYSTSQLAPMVVEYLKKYGYTHIEVLPPYEHPLDASWGYQGTGYYAISSRWGSPKDFMYFVDYMHQNGIGVIIDWVPGHTCKDSFGLYEFDGTHLYEYSKPEDRETEWGTVNLDLGKGVTKTFLYSNAFFYLKYFHVDGFRVDAVSNLIYWQGNSNRGVNQGCLDFIRELSTLLFKYDDRLIFSAEDSSSFPNVTTPTGMGGLGFNYKWDMGWMNDTLKYFKLDPIYRQHHHNLMTFSMMYYYNEQFVLTFSHDEIVHMKGSLLNKMPGDRWKQFANYKALLGYMMTHPGKKLLMMGNELASYDEWHYEKSLPWNLNTFPDHDAAQRFIRELTLLYKNEAPLWELDYNKDGFLWLDADNNQHSLFSYARFDKAGNHIIVVLNCTPNTYTNYRIGVNGYNKYEEIINSDKDIYGGANNINPNEIVVEEYPQGKWKNSIMMTIPPLGISILRHIEDPVKLEAIKKAKAEKEAQEKAKKKEEEASKTQKNTKCGAKSA